MVPIILLLIQFFVGLNLYTSQKNHYERELNIIYDIVHKNNYHLNTIKKNHKPVTQNIIQMPSINNIVYYSSTKYRDN